MAISKVLALMLLFAIAFDSLKSDNYVGSNTEKKPQINLQNQNKKLRKELRSDKFCYCKVGRMIIKWGTKEKSSILLSQYWKNYQKNISYLEGTINIFADCTSLFNK